MSPAVDTDKAETQSEFFRCPVQADQSRGSIKIGRRTITATVQDASIEGFTVLVEPKNAKRLSVGIPWILDYNGARLEVQAQWFFHAPDGHVQVGLRRLRDLTPPDKVGGWWPSAATAGRVEDASHSTLAFAGFILVLFVTMAMPGLGEKLGTADRIARTFHWAWDGISDQLSRIW